MSPISGTAHIVTVFDLFPCPSQHVWGDGFHVIDYSFPEKVSLLSLYRNNRISFYKPNNALSLLLRRRHIAAIQKALSH